jgi:hypothetical protein
MSTSEVILTTILSALSATGATVLTILAAWWQLQKTEAYRRASRWEPMAERLWQERFNVYERMLAAVDGIGEAIRHGSAVDFDKSTREVVAAHRRLQVFEGARVLKLSVDVMRVNNDLLRIIESHGIEALTRTHLHALTQTVSDMQTAMRIDLGIQVLDSLSDDWFKRTKGEALHEEWRKIIWQSMGRIERDPPAEAS